MSRLLVGAAVLVFVALTTPTIAAEVPPVVTPPIYNWSGCYFGGNAGGQSAHPSGTFNVYYDSPRPPESFVFSAGNSASFIGGGQMGCNYQSGQLVFGVEGDADWRRLSRTGSLVPGFIGESGYFSLTSNWDFCNWQVSIRSRLGYAVDRMLWYATGGVAWTRLSLGANVLINAPAPGPYNIATVTEVSVGWILGGGVEYAVGERVTLGLEGRYTRYRSQHFNTLATLAVPDLPLPATGDLNVNSSGIIGKANFKFSSNSQSTEPPQMRRNQ
jgi:outer membrane immunogenic protein